MDVPPIPKASSPEALEQRVSTPVQEPALPRGRSLNTVQAHPAALISSPPPAGSESTQASERLRAVQSRVEITGTGVLVDTWA